MKEFREVPKEEVINELKNGKEVRAVILNSNSHLVKGGEHIREGVYQLNCKMSIADVGRYEREENVAFYVYRTEENESGEN